MAHRDKIYISDEAEDIYALLQDDKPDVPTRPFRFAREVFMAAAVVGFIEDRFKELKASGKKDKFGWSTLLHDANAVPVLRAIALCKTQDPSILLDDDIVASIGESFANGGIEKLKEIVCGGSDELMDTASYMMEHLNSVIDDDE